MKKTEFIKGDADQFPERPEKKDRPAESALKYALSALSGGLVSAGGFFAWGLSNDFTTGEDDFQAENRPETEPASPDEITNNVLTEAKKAGMSKFDEAFATARSEKGAGEVFEYNGNYYGTYYKEEWDAMSVKDKKEYYSSVDEKISKLKATAEESAPTENQETVKIATMVSDEMDDVMALVVARDEVGSGQLYYHDGELFSTYTVEELMALSPEELARVQQIAQQAQVSEQYIQQTDDYEEIILDQAMLRISDDSFEEIEILVDDPAEDLSQYIVIDDDPDTSEISIEYTEEYIVEEMESDLILQDNDNFGDSPTDSLFDTNDGDPDSPIDSGDIDFIADPPLLNT